MKKFEVKLEYSNTMDRLDYTHDGFVLDHDYKVFFIRVTTDRAIRNGNLRYLIKFTELRAKYPDYQCGFMLT